MQKPDFGFDAQQLLTIDPLPSQDGRIAQRVWLVPAGVQIVPLAFNDVSKMYHAVALTTTEGDWLVQEGLVHRVVHPDMSWVEESEIPLYVEFTQAQQDRAGQNVRGFLCLASGLIFLSNNATAAATAIPQSIQEYKNRAQSLNAVMRNDPSKELKFAFKKESDGSQWHVSPTQLMEMFNKAASKLGGYDKLVSTNSDGEEVIDWKGIVIASETQL